MLRNWLIAGASAAGILVGGTALAEADVVYVYSFETSNVATGHYLYSADAQSFSDPAGTVVSAPGATFAGFSGIQSNGSAWGFQPAPDGTFTGFLQSYNTNIETNLPGSFSLALSGLTSGSTYTLSFYIAARPGFTADPFNVSIGADNLGNWTASSPTWTQETVTFTYNGAATLDFTGTAQGAGDFSVGVDAVSVSTIPEPSTWAMMIAGFAGLGLIGARRGRRAVSVID
jgi:hypothetical protein